MAHWKDLKKGEVLYFSVLILKGENIFQEQNCKNINKHIKQKLSILADTFYSYLI